MLWFSLSLLTALLSATEGAWLKQRFSDLGFLEMAAFPFFYGLPVYLLAAWLTLPATLPGEFWFWCGAMLPLNIAGFLLHVRAIHVSPLSLTMPFLSFTPAFVILTGRLVLDERLGLVGICGVLAVALGGYVLGRSPEDGSLLAPFRRLARERGPVYMLGAALLYSLCAVMGKKLITLSGPLFFASCFQAMFGVVLLTILFGLGRIKVRTLLSRPVDGILAALISVLLAASHHLALALTKTAYMIAIKRLNALFSVGFGWFWFRETELRQRLTGAALMTAGAVVIALWG